MVSETEEGIKDVFEQERGKKLPIAERRHYAKAKRTFELGLWGHPLHLIKGVELTTRSGNRNTRAELIRDNRNLRLKMRREGWLAEDCFAMEVSPKHGLLHLHGFYRVTERIPAAKLHGMLSKYWSAIHGAPVVWVQDIYSAEGLMKYNLKHALKNYVNYGFKHWRILKSKKWLPVGARKVERLLVAWALEHGGLWGSDDDLDVFQGEYIAYAFEQADDYLWRWCNDEMITLWFDAGMVVIDGHNIFDERRYENDV